MAKRVMVDLIKREEAPDCVLLGFVSPLTACQRIIAHMVAGRPREQWNPRYTLPKTPQPGTLIHNTLRQQDLLLAFWDEWASVDPITFLDQWENPKRQRILVRWARGAWASLPWDDPSNAFTQNVAHMVADAYDALDRVAPPGYAFGACEGNASDFGYWQVSDGEQDDGDNT